MPRDATRLWQLGSAAYSGTKGLLRAAQGVLRARRTCSPESAEGRYFHHFLHCSPFFLSPVSVIRQTTEKVTLVSARIQRQDACIGPLGLDAWHQQGPCGVSAIHQGMNLVMAVEISAESEQWDGSMPWSSPHAPDAAWLMPHLPLVLFSAGLRVAM